MAMHAKRPIERAGTQSDLGSRSPFRIASSGGTTKRKKNNEDHIDNFFGMSLAKYETTSWGMRLDSMPRSEMPDLTEGSFHKVLTFFDPDDKNNIIPYNTEAYESEFRMVAEQIPNFKETFCGSKGIVEDKCMWARGPPEARREDESSDDDRGLGSPLPSFISTPHEEAQSNDTRAPPVSARPLPESAPASAAAKGYFPNAEIFIRSEDDTDVVWKIVADRVDYEAIKNGFITLRITQRPKGLKSGGKKKDMSGEPHHRDTNVFKKQHSPPTSMELNKKEEEDVDNKRIQNASPAAVAQMENPQLQGAFSAKKGPSSPPTSTRGGSDVGPPKGANDPLYCHSGIPPSAVVAQEGAGTRKVINMRGAQIAEKKIYPPHPVVREGAAARAVEEATGVATKKWNERGNNNLDYEKSETYARPKVVRDDDQNKNVQSGVGLEEQRRASIVMSKNTAHSRCGYEAQIATDDVLLAREQQHARANDERSRMKTSPSAAQLVHLRSDALQPTKIDNTSATVPVIPKNHDSISGSSQKKNCSVPECKSLARGKVIVVDRFGQPGPRCMRHGVKGRCTARSCTNTGLTRVLTMDHFGPPGPRCHLHTSTSSSSSLNGTAPSTSMPITHSQPIKHGKLNGGGVVVDNIREDAEVSIVSSVSVGKRNNMMRSLSETASESETESEFAIINDDEKPVWSNSSSSLNSRPFSGQGLGSRTESLGSTSIPLQNRPLPPMLSGLDPAGGLGGEGGGGNVRKPAICSVPGCESKSQGRVMPGEGGPPEPRCFKHGGGPRCSIDGCFSGMISKVSVHDEFGQPGNRCVKHGAPKRQRGGQKPASPRS